MDTFYYTHEMQPIKLRCDQQFAYKPSIVSEPLQYHRDDMSVLLFVTVPFLLVSECCSCNTSQ